MKKFNLIKNYYFLKIRSKIKNRLKIVFKSDWKGVIKKLESGKNYNFKNDLDFMTEIESSLSFLIKNKLPKKYRSMEFPANIRISHNNPPKKYMHRPFATDNIHQDAWSGEPIDSHIFFVYLFVYKKCSFIKVFKKSKKLNKFKNFIGRYDKIQISEKDLKEVKLLKKAGQAILFDTNTPHKSERGINGIRISLDVRLRVKNPYLKNKKIYSLCEFSKNKLLKQGKFWLYPKTKLFNFYDKLKFEYQKIKSFNNPKIYKLRKSYVNQIKI